MTYHLACRFATADDLKRFQNEAEAPYRRALKVQDRLVAEYPEVSLYRFDRSRTEINLGTLLDEVGHASEAEPMLRHAWEILEGPIRDSPKIVEYQRRTLPEALVVPGKRYRESGRLAEALRAYRRHAEILSSFPDLSADELVRFACVRAQCAALTAANRTRPAGDKTADFDRAMDLLRRAVAMGISDPARFLSRAKPLDERETNGFPVRPLVRSSTKNSPSCQKTF